MASCTAWQVLRGFVRHPIRRLWRRWNWKSALLSATSRSLLFFAANLTVGFRAAVAASLTEALFRSTTAGFYGAMTQAFRRVTPPWFGTLTVMVLLPAVSHSLEFGVHYLRGTAALALSMSISVIFTALSSAFNLFAMRHGLLIVGSACQSLTADLIAVPSLILSSLRALRQRLPSHVHQEHSLYERVSRNLRRDSDVLPGAAGGGQPQRASRQARGAGRVLVYRRRRPVWPDLSHRRTALAGDRFAVPADSSASIRPECPRAGLADLEGRAARPDRNLR